MFWTIVKKTLLEDILDGKVAVLFLFCGILIPLGIGLSAKDFHRRQAEYEMTRNSGGELPAPRPLSILARGIDGEQYSTVENLLIADNESPDVLFMVRVILSLIAILLGALSISEEQEKRTLKLILSNPVPRHTVILSKGIAGMLSLLYPFALAFVFGLLAVLLLWRIPFSGSDWLRIAEAFVLSFLYLVVFYNVGLMISSCFSTGAVSSYVAFAVWIGLVFALPLSSKMVIKKWHTVPSIMEVEQRKTNVRYELADRSQGFNYGGPEERKRWKELDLERLRRMDQQLGWGRTILGVLPSGALTFGLTSLADTGVEFYDHVLEPWTLKEKVPGGLSMTISEAVGRFMWPFGILMIYNVLFFLIGYAIFLRKEIG